MLQEAINELARLYRLKEEGKEVQVLIDRLENLIREYCDLCEAE